MKKYFIIIVASLFILFWAYNASRVVVSPNSGKQDALLMPNLAKDINSIGAVIIRSKGKSFNAHLQDGKWVMPNRYNYPVGAEKIRDLVQNSAHIKIIEGKTSDPTNFADLGLDGPEKPGSSSIRITLLSGDEKTTYADYIRGVTRKGFTAKAGRNEIYARLFDSNQSYLVHSDLNFDLTPHMLLSGETFAIKYQNLSSVNFNYPQHLSDNFTLGKDTPEQLDFAITEPEEKVLKGFGKANAISTSLEYMELEDILKREDFPVKEPELIITYKTFNGLTLVVNLFKKEDESWLTFAATPAENDKQSAEDAARINTLASPWVYKVDFKSTGGFYYKLEDLLKD